MIIKILLADYFNPIPSLQVSILNLLLRAGCKPDQDCVRLAQLRWPQVPMFADPIIITIISTTIITILTITIIICIILMVIGHRHHQNLV